MLNNVADKFLDMALNQALFGDILGAGGDKGGGLLGLLGFAKGGRPPVGRPSIVGEKGPELFVPRSSGTIVPNNKLGGGGSTSVVVNVDASGTDVQGDDGQAKELGTLISVAVQGELIKQQRPGGLLASTR
jgi:phage-related minor tail protein